MFKLFTYNSKGLVLIDSVLKCAFSAMLYECKFVKVDKQKKPTHFLSTAHPLCILHSSISTLFINTCFYPQVYVTFHLVVKDLIFENTPLKC